MSPNYKLRAAVVAGVAFSLFASVGRATDVEITLSGADFNYSDVTDQIFANADALSGVSITSGGAPVTGSPFGAGATLDLLISDVSVIPFPANPAIPSNATSLNGSLSVNLPGGDSVDLTLGPGAITFSQQSVTYEATALVSQQSLPDGVLLSGSIDISLTALINNNFTSNTVVINSFSAQNGVFDISGSTVPEPSTAALVVCSACLIVSSRRRSRRAE